jgi:uncharacterized membrane protein (UPF0182 family)
MFVVPIEDSIMYVEPIYLKAVDSSMPEVKRIILYYNDKIAYESTLAGALDAMFGEGTGDEIRTNQPTGDTGDADSEPGDTDVDGQPDTGATTGTGGAIGAAGDAQQMTTDELIKAVADTYNRATDAQRAGDWAKYGEEMALLKTYIDRLNSM